MTSTINNTTAACSCATMNGRLRDICEGHADLPLTKINAYREAWGMPPLGEMPPRSARVREPSPRKATGCASCGKRVKPTLLQRAVKLAQATARHLADDNAPTAPEALAFREQQCGNCPLMQNDECTACGCSLQPNLLNQGKLRWRSEACPVGKWSRHNATYRPLVNPARNLIFHVYPLNGAEWNWHWHLDQIRKHASLFNGKIVIAVVTGHNLAHPDAVKARLDGIPVEWIIRENSKLAETVTCLDLLRSVETADPNTITLRGHTKGATHKRDSVEQHWARLLWETMTDINSVQDALASHIFAGVLKSHEPLVRRKPGDWFYAGSWYWFRSDIYQRDWQRPEANRWWIEYLPGHVASNAEAACLLHDFTKSSVLDLDYWRTEIQPDIDLWRESRAPIR